MVREGVRNVSYNPYNDISREAGGVGRGLGKLLTTTYINYLYFLSVKVGDGGTEI